jgi:G3E family GTPase
VSELAASALYDYLIVETAGETDPIALAQAFEAPQAAANSQKLSDLARVRCFSFSLLLSSLAHTASH